MASKPIKVVQKNRFRALALPLANDSGLRPALASGDYILFPIHDGSQNAIRVSRDSYFGQAKHRSQHWQWYSLDIALEYPETDPDAPPNSKIHYIFKTHTPYAVDFDEMKRYVNRVLSALYGMLGRGVGSVYASIMPTAMVDDLIAKGKIEEAKRRVDTDIWFHDWEVGFTDDLHYVDPESIPEWSPVAQ